MYAFYGQMKDFSLEAALFLLLFPEYIETSSKKVVLRILICCCFTLSEIQTVPGWYLPMCQAFGVDDGEECEISYIGFLEREATKRSAESEMSMYIILKKIA